MATTTSPTELGIATVVDGIGRQFISLVNALVSSPRYATQVSPAQVEDEFSRFKMWAGNVAAHRKGRRSLEYRLRDATALKLETHQFLGALSAALHSALGVAIGERTPWDELSMSDSDSELESDNDDHLEVALQGDTELKQILSNIKTIVSSLFRLAMSIRNPAPTNQSTSHIDADKSMYEQFDLQHVHAKFPGCPQYLSERLGRAITARRQYLSHREQHHQKLAKHVEKIGLDSAKSEFTTNSTEATPLPRIERVNDFDVLNEDDDTASQTSYATSVNSAMGVPRLPKEASEKEFFECPLCFLLVSIHSVASWRQHVYRDLHPYSCTHKDCVLADRLYDSRKAWFSHELEAHYAKWQCAEGCNKIFGVKLDFEYHVRAAHPDLALPSILSALGRTSVHRASLVDIMPCGLCGKMLSLRALQRHVGSHQQQLALFALPTDLNDAEDDPDDAEDNSMNRLVSESEVFSDTSEELHPDEDDMDRIDDGDEAITVDTARSVWLDERDSVVQEQESDVAQILFSDDAVSPYYDIPTDDISGFSTARHGSMPEELHVSAQVISEADRPPSATPEQQISQDQALKDLEERGTRLISVDPSGFSAEDLVEAFTKTIFVQPEKRSLDPDAETRHIGPLPMASDLAETRSENDSTNEPRPTSDTKGKGRANQLHDTHARPREDYRQSPDLPADDPTRSSERAAFIHVIEHQETERSLGTMYLRNDQSR
ncbi:hypothetical protein ACN47E_000832 [Coniothyrium glycines]